MDLFLERTPYVNEAEQLFSFIERGKVKGFLSATTITTLEYLLAKALTRKHSNEIIMKLLQLFEIAVVDRSFIEAALGFHFTDFEDAVIYSAAVHCKTEGIVTHDLKGFKKAELPIYNAPEIIAMLS